MAKKLGVPGLARILRENRRIVPGQGGPLRLGAWIGLFLLCIAALLLPACAQHGQSADAGQGENSGQAPVDFLNLPQQPVGSIGLALATHEPQDTGAQTLRVSLSVSDAGQLYQFSCRLAYNPRALRPISAVRGDLVDSRAAFFAPMGLPEEAVQNAFVPFAFTYHPGEMIPAAAGELASLEFEILDPKMPPDLAVLQDSGFLIARNSRGEPLEVKLELSQ